MNSELGADNHEIMDRVKQEVAALNAKEFLTKISEKCFKKCVNKPGAQLDSSEQKCILMCVDRFLESWNLVTKTYGERIRREQQKF